MRGMKGPRPLLTRLAFLVRVCFVRLKVEGIQGKIVVPSPHYGVGSSMKPGRISRVLRYKIGGMSASSRGL